MSAPGAHFTGGPQLLCWPWRDRAHASPGHSWLMQSVGASQIVAIHLQETSLNGTVPCSWAGAGLQSLGIIRNQYITGPLDICFAAVTDENVNINIAKNSNAAPICGSGSTENVVARQIQKCSELAGVPTVWPPPAPLALAPIAGGMPPAARCPCWLTDVMGSAAAVCSHACLHACLHARMAAAWVHRRPPFRRGFRIPVMEHRRYSGVWESDVVPMRARRWQAWKDVGPVTPCRVLEGQSVP